MIRRLNLNRRGFLTGVAGLIGATTVGGCDRLPQTTLGKRALQAGEDANLFVQRLLLTQATLAPEYPESDIGYFKPNGTSEPPDATYKALARKQFADFRLKVGGLVDKPFQISLNEMRAMPSRTQITRHDCVEGWSCIGKWTGVPMKELLDRAGLRPSARYVVMHCADTMEGGEAEEDGSEGGTAQKGSERKRAPAIRYYETIDLTDAFHPQTILAYEMNDKALPVAHGAPLRLRVERALGYKMAKYVMQLDVVDSYDKIGDGKGGYWEDRGYDWYAGI